MSIYLLNATNAKNYILNNFIACLDNLHYFFNPFNMSKINCIIY